MQTKVIRATLTTTLKNKNIFAGEMLNPNNEKYSLKNIGYKLYIIYNFSSTTTAIANLISLVNI